MLDFWTVFGIVIIAAIGLFTSEHRIFSILEKKYPKKYEELDEPKWYFSCWSFRYYRVFYGLLFNTIKLPKNSEIKKCLIIFRVSFIIVIIFALMFAEIYGRYRY